MIYDAAHAFGVMYKKQSLLIHGDISTLSFHATKLFHTVEGGALVTNDDGVAHCVGYMRNFGHKTPEEFWGVGINGKNSEFHAAMGLCVLPKVPELIERRSNLSCLYNDRLDGMNLKKPHHCHETKYNFAYYPVLFPSEEHMLAVMKSLNEARIFPRRYFYPALNQLNYVDYRNTPVAEDVVKRVLCFPLYPGLATTDVEAICTVIKSAMEKCLQLEQNTCVYC